MNQDGGFRSDIEGLRGLAVLLVVLGHAGSLLEGGYVGVDVFFVVSGFLITSHLCTELLTTGTISLGQFYARRIRRLLPLASFVIIATVIASWLWLAPLRMKGIGLDATFASLFLVNGRLAAIGTDYFAWTGAISPLQHFWSLSVEEQFYLLWPAVMGLVWLFGRTAERFRKWASYVLIALSVLSFGVSHWLTGVAQPWAYFSLWTRVWELACGGFLALNSEWLESRLSRFKAVTSWLGLVLVFVGVALYRSVIPYTEFAALPCVVGAVLFICSNAASHPWSAASILTFKPLRFVGRISYSLYLWHWPVFIIVPEVVGHVLTIPEKLMAMVGAFALSVITYWCIERPFQKNARLKASLYRTYTCAVFLVLLALTISLPFALKTSKKDLVANVVSPYVSQEEALHAVQEAASIAVLPHQLMVPLEDVASDHPPKRCMEDPMHTAPTTASTCRVGTASAQNTIVLFGDSHAHQWLDAFSIIAEQHNIQLVAYTMPGCPLSNTHVRHPVNHSDNTQCYAWRRQVVDRIRALKPAQVVLAELQRYAEAPTLGSLLDELQSSSTRVTYLLDTPYPDDSSPECLSKHPDALQRCSLQRRTAIDPVRRSTLMNVVLQHGARIVDPIDWFCAQEVCPVVIDRIAAYRDNSHISSSYAKNLATVLEKKLFDQ